MALLQRNGNLKVHKITEILVTLKLISCAHTGKVERALENGIHAETANLADLLTQSYGAEVQNVPTINCCLSTECVSVTRAFRFEH